MENEMTLPISIEKFAAYLDGNLSEDEMSRIDALVQTNPDMEELISISDIVDEDCQALQNDQFALEAELTALEGSDFEIPDIDADSFTSEADNEFEMQDVADTEITSPESDDFNELSDNGSSSTDEDFTDNGETPMGSYQDLSEGIIDTDFHSIGDSDEISIGNDYFES